MSKIALLKRNRLIDCIFILAIVAAGFLVQQCFEPPPDVTVKNIVASGPIKWHNYIPRLTSLGWGPSQVVIDAVNSGSDTISGLSMVPEKCIYIIRAYAPGSSTACFSAQVPIRSQNDGGGYYATNQYPRLDNRYHDPQISDVFTVTGEYTVVITTVITYLVPQQQEPYEPEPPPPVETSFSQNASATFKVDRKAPSAPSNFRITVDEPNKKYPREQTDPAAGLIYIGGDSMNMAWDPGRDEHCDYPTDAAGNPLASPRYPEDYRNILSYNMYHGAAKTLINDAPMPGEGVDNLDVSGFPEGLQQLYFTSVDTLGNESDNDTSVPVPFYLDRTPPALVTGISSDLLSEIINGKERVNKIQLNWQPVTADRSTDDQSDGSGVFGYDVTWVEAQAFAAMQANGTEQALQAQTGMSDITATATVIGIDERAFERGKYYVFGVKSVDNVGNRSRWTWLPGVFIPVGPLEIEGVSNTGATYNPASGVPEYRQQVRFSWGKDDLFLPGKDEHRIGGIDVLVKPDAAAQPVATFHYDASAIADVSRNLGPGWEEQDGKLVLNTTLSGAAHAHKSYQFSVRTVYPGGKVDESDPRQAEPVDNIAPDFTVQVKDKEGTLLGTIGKDGYETPGSGTVFHRYVNEEVYFNLVLASPSGSQADVEGDVLKYSLYTINKSPIEDSWTDQRKGPIELRSFESVIYHCYVAVEEYTSNAGGGERSLSDVYGANMRRATLHQPGNEGFYIHFDLAEGMGAFVLYSRDGARMLSKTTPTGTEQVSVVVEQNAITDTIGSVSSGINNVSVWNVDTSRFVSLDYVTAEDVRATEPSQKTSLGISSGPGEDAPSARRAIDWDLTAVPANDEQVRIVGMKVTDKALPVGNDYYFLRIVKVDKIPPVKPDISTFSHTYMVADDRINVSWAAGALQERYQATYRLSPGANPITVEINEPLISVPVGGYGPNEAVGLKVAALDLALNKSDEVTYTPYTLASLGTMTGEQGYNDTLEHYFRWTVTGARATRLVLELLNASGTVIGELNADASGVIVHGGLNPHGTYRYQLAAYNGSGYATRGTSFAQTVENVAPGAPSGLLPTGWAMEQVQLHWNAAGDLDGDAITYAVYLAEGGTGSFQLIGKTQDIACVYPEGTGRLELTEGETYRYYVVADDTPSNNAYVGKSAASVTASFMVDGTAPVITFVTSPEETGSATELVVELFDAVSGVANAWYWTSDGLEGSETNPVALSLQNAGGGKYEGRIPLHEGSYRVYVRARDVAGNESVASTEGEVIDRTAPEVRAMQVLLPAAVGGNVGSSGAIPVQMTLWDNYSGIKGIRYGYAAAPTGEVSEWKDVALEPVEAAKEANKEKAYARTLGLPGVDGTVYYLVVQAYDWAGNYSSESRTPAGILFDASAPEVSVAVQGLHEVGGRYYLDNIDKAVLNASYNDPHSSIRSVSYAIGEADADGSLLVWHDDYQGAKGTALTGGKSYAIRVRATNNVGLETVERSAAFVFDDTPAGNLSVSGLPTAPVVPGEEVRLVVKATEAESAIEEYAVAIGTADDETVFSRLVTGNEAGWRVVRAPVGEAVIQLKVPEIADGTYQVRFRVRNATGAESAVTAGGGIVVDRNQERLVVTTEGMYSTLADSLKAGWSYHGTRTVASYAYRILGPEGALVGWTAGGDKGVEANGLTLENGASYVFEVRATFAGGAETLLGQSQGITVDWTAPQFAALGGINAPAACPSNGLWVSFNASDAESGIGKVQVLLETPDGAGGLTPVSGGWCDVAFGVMGEKVLLQTDATGKALELETGEKVYLTLRLTNGAGLSGEKAVPVITIDDTPPPVPQVVDIGEVINTAQYPTAHWQWTKEDPESGTRRFEWTITRSRDELASAVWHEDDGTREARVEEVLGASFNRVHGETWYFAVRAYNGAGLSSVGMSNGVLYDNTAPFIAEVKLVQGIEAEELLYVESFGNTNVLIAAYEDISSISAYQAMTGRRDAQGEWEPGPSGTTYTSTEARIPLSPAPPAANGEIVVIRGTCLNQSNLVSEYGYCKGTMVITQTPAVTAVRGRVSRTELFFDWDVDDAGVPVNGYNVELRAIGSGAVAHSASVTEKSIVLDAAALGIGDGSYALYVKARSVIGLTSAAWGVSPPVVIDHTGPEIRAFSAPAYASRSLRLYCEARDDQSGISEYQYRIGTFEDGGLLTEGWRSVFSKQGVLELTVAFDDLPAGWQGIPDGTALHARIRVKNGVGLWSPEKTSGAVIIDKTPAATPSVRTASAYTKYDYKIEGVGLASEDAQSGITHYAYAAVQGTDAAALAAAQWREVVVGPGVFSLSVSNVVLDELALQHGSAYYAAVRVRNGAGDWSAVGFSPAVTADLKAPAIQYAGGPDTIVINGAPAEITYAIEEDVSPDVTLTLILQLATGGSIEYPAVTVVPGQYEYTFMQSAYGTYQLQAVLTDRAGNESGVIRQDIRVNSPPVLTLNGVDTTPGKPQTLSVYASDEDRPLRYQWDFGDGQSAEGSDPVHRYYHSAQYAQESVYTLRVTVTDKWGLSSSAQTTVTVRNTEAGQLYADEYWSGEHVIRGDILVPAAYHLTVMSGAHVKIVNDPVKGYDHRLTVEGKLTVERDSLFAVDGSETALWNGILVTGEASLDGAEIRDARRGLTAGPGAQVTLTGTAFRHNEIGVHVFGLIAVTDCVFKDNLLYGIKEDGEASPAVNGCRFAGNLYDYYDRQRTIIAVDQLNLKPGCAGNSKE